MARYMEIAAEANPLAKQLLDMVSEAQQPVAAGIIAKLFNYGFRCNPRAAHGTIRLNSVRTATKGLPVRCRMVEGEKFNHLEVTPVYPPGVTPAPVVPELEAA